VTSLGAVSSFRVAKVDIGIFNVTLTSISTVIVILWGVLTIMVFAEAGTWHLDLGNLAIGGEDTSDITLNRMDGDVADPDSPRVIRNW
jgi:hypothetical protein